MTTFNITTIFGAVIIAVGLAACGPTDTIYLKNVSTGATATCGAHSLSNPYAIVASTVAVVGDQDCVRDYKEQGFVRVPGLT
jgi:hypothetical protein